MTDPIKAKTDAELEALAAQVRSECSALKEHIQTGLHHAVRAGELLIQAKELVRHGQWLPWLRENCDLSERSAQAYMRVARRYPELAGKTATVADLTYRGALHLLSEPKEDDSPKAIVAVGPHDDLSKVMIARGPRGVIAFSDPDDIPWVASELLPEPDEYEKKLLIKLRRELEHFLDGSWEDVCRRLGELGRAVDEMGGATKRPARRR